MKMVTLADDLDADDIIIAVMGPTGVGKSNFIDVLAQRPDKRAGYGLSSCTNDIQISFLDHPLRRVVLVELPSFDNTEKTEEEVLHMIDNWLMILAAKGIWLAGILYMHRIDRDIAKPASKDLRILRQIHDKTTTVQIRLVTTMWDGLESVEIGEGREEILKKNFRLFLWTLEDSRDGDRQRTFDQTNSQDVQFLRFLNTMDSAKSIAYALVSETIAREGSKLEGTSQLGVAGQKPAKTPGKKVRQFESPVRTKKVRFLPESISNKDRKPATNGPVTPTPHFSIDESQPLEERLLDLTSKIAKTTESRKAFSNTDFSRNEAQLIADYLNIILHEANIFSNGRDGAHILGLLCELANSAEVYPQCYILRGIKKEPEPFEGGGFADIYKGTYQDQTICLKVIRIFQKGADRNRILRNYMKEMLLWAHLSHDNVLPFYGVYCLDETAQRLCLVSPWMKNRNLREYLEVHPNASRILLTQDITEGLLHLHRVRIIHGDLKTQNILVSDDERALIADFGLSTIAMTTTRGVSSGTTTGCTTHWAAPELVAETDGLTKPTKESDIWSFGCLCLEIFTGKIPFYRCEQPPKVVVALLKGEKPHQPRSGDNICKPLDKWISKMMLECWKTSPRKRPTCEKIRGILKANSKEHDERPKASVPAVDKSTFWQDMRAQSDIKVDYQRVEQIMHQFQSTRIEHPSNTPKTERFSWRKFRML